MKKVVYSIRNTRGNQDKKLSGFGYVAEGNLLVPCISKNNKPYIRTLDGVDKACHPVKDRPGEYSGYITMYYEQVPEVYWDKMEPFVLDNYLAALTRIQEMGEQAE